MAFRNLPKLPFVFRLIGSFSLPVVSRLGWLAGWLTFLFSPRYRWRLTANLGLAFPDGIPKGLLRAAVAEGGRQAMEAVWVLVRPQDQVLKQVCRVSGEEYLRAAQAAGRGVLFLTPHLGCFEITAQYLAVHHGSVLALYRKPKRSSLGQLIQTGRQRGNMAIAPADMSGVRQLLKALRQRRMVGILPDQAPGVGEGVWAPFFGKPAWTMTLAARLSEVPGTEVLTVVGERLPGGQGWFVRMAPMVELLEGDTVTRAQIINREMERLILSCPAQYLWSYNRYKVPEGVVQPPEWKN